MSINQLRSRSFGLILLLAMAAVLAGCSGGMAERDLDRSDEQTQMLRQRALNQSELTTNR